MATKTKGAKKKIKKQISLDFTLSSEDDKENEPKKELHHYKGAHAGGKLKKKAAGKKTLRNLFDDFSCSEEETAPIKNSKVSSHDITVLDDVLARAKKKKPPSRGRQIENKIKGISITGNNQLSAGRKKTIPLNLSTSSNTASDQSSFNSTKSSLPETLELADQLSQLLISAKKDKNKSKKKRTARQINNMSAIKHTLAQPMAVSSPNSKLLQTFVMDSDQDDLEPNREPPTRTNREALVPSTQEAIDNDSAKARNIFDSYATNDSSKECATVSPNRILFDGESFIADTQESVRSQVPLDRERSHGLFVPDSQEGDESARFSKFVPDSQEIQQVDALYSNLGVRTPGGLLPKNVTVIQDSFDEGKDESLVGEEEKLLEARNLSPADNFSTETTDGSRLNTSETETRTASSVSVQASFVSSDNEEDFSPHSAQNSPSTSVNIEKQSTLQSCKVCDTSNRDSSLTNQSFNCQISLSNSMVSDNSSAANSPCDLSKERVSVKALQDRGEKYVTSHSFNCQVSLPNSSTNEESSAASSPYNLSKKNISLQASFNSSEDDSSDNSNTEETPLIEKETVEHTTKNISLQASFSDSECSGSDAEPPTQEPLKADASTSDKSPVITPSENSDAVSETETSPLLSKRPTQTSSEIPYKDARPGMVSLSDDSDVDVAAAAAVAKDNTRKNPRRVHDVSSDSDVAQNRARKAAQRKLSETESEESDLESFFDRMKKPAKQFTHSPPRSEESDASNSMDEFIVPDDEVSMDDSPGFYLKNDRKLRKRVNTRAYREPHMSSSDESAESNLDTNDDTNSSDEYSPEVDNNSDSSDLEMDPVPPKDNATHSKDTHARDLKKDDNSYRGDSETSDEPNMKTKTVGAQAKTSVTQVEISDDDSFDLPYITPATSIKQHKKANGALSERLTSVRKNWSKDLKSNESDDFANDSVFRTPKNLLVRPKTNVTRTPSNQQPPAHHGLTVPSRRPLTLVQDVPERPASASDSRKSACSFLESLSEDLAAHRRHPEAARFVKNFKKLREELTQKLFHLFNENVFDKQFPADLNIKWNVRLTKTAGYYSHKKLPLNGDRAAGSRIELSVKVCDRAERLRDTLMHELCHAAVWIVHGVRESHGPYWKHFARKANRVYPELAVVERCHNYKIECKFTYRCTSCGYEIGRHSKSLDTEKLVCGYCKAPFQLIVNSARTNSKSSISTPRTPNRFAMFVKENYGSVKKSGGLDHRSVMQQLSKDFAAQNKLS